MIPFTPIPTLTFWLVIIYYTYISPLLSNHEHTYFTHTLTNRPLTIYIGRGGSYVYYFPFNSKDAVWGF